MMGNIIFTFYGITVYAFKIAGGILFLRIGINMLEAKVSRTKSTPKESEEASENDDIALTPIGIPLIAGPGAITSVMILAAQANSFDQKVIFYLNIVITLFITFMILKLGKKLTRKLGTAGLRVIERIMGLILMVVAIQFIIDVFPAPFEPIKPTTSPLVISKLMLSTAFTFLFDLWKKCLNVAFSPAFYSDIT